MPLTPADVHNVAFKKPPIGKRGYDEDEVDAFLDLVEAEFARLIEENAELRSRVAEGGTAQSAPPTEPVPAQAGSPPTPEAQDEPTPPAPARPVMDKPAPADELTQATRMLSLATETAERHVAEAREEGDRLLTEARTASEQTIAEANTKSEQQLAEAKNRAETLDRDSVAKARTLTQDAERRQNEIMGSLEKRKAGLEREIDALRTFEREYRTRLKSYLESQLRDLDARTSAEPAGAGAQQGTGASGNSASQSSN